MTTGASAGPASPPPVTIYRTEISAAGAPWRLGIDLALGFAWDSSRSIPQPVVHLAGQDVSAFVALTVDEQRCLVISFDLTGLESIACASTPTPYLRARATISADGASLRGTVTRVCAGDVACAWRGTCDAIGAAWLVGMWSWTMERTGLNRGMVVRR